MRRNSVLILLGMIVLLIVIAALLSYTLVRSPANDTIATGTGVPVQQAVPLSEPDGIPMRLVYIVSVLIVFVSAALVLLRLLLGLPGKDKK